MSEPVEVLITVPLSDTLLNLLREISSNLHFTLYPSAQKVEDIPAEVWARSEVLFTQRLVPTAESAPHLRWIQFYTTNTSSLIDAPLLQQAEVIATDLSGATAIQIAEHAVMMVLALGHSLHLALNSQEQVEWAHDRLERTLPVELYNSTVGIIGYGSIGRQIAHLLHPFGATILATKHDVFQPQETGYAIHGLGDPQGNLFHRLYPVEALKSMLRLCDFSVICLPLTAETRNLISTEELNAARPASFLVDVSAGGILDHEALILALQEHHFGGVALDVFPEEPLADTSPLWRMPEVMLTPHIAGASAHFDERAIILFSENLNRYLAHQPLFNQINPAAGY